ncbi:class I SAM-dependent methyltransferase [Polynucleobacter sp. 15G-AUS-farblos]|uniref:TylF/MycF/NovP-related O-methyltransferase n=1 Tax=Polynucleobacter sp. 15G-AUS-farblos TaxID=2689094 RepID=UPI001C0E6138|nr:TylF/MycF/NovP-related O-methyltransferase [Polynucleobacter sp. 15G-AUS-farblos]MBU3584087.1 class I SAM-dependent methyltransferase [Polynucleobacter sp. 15G-AUS-farblos]
MIHKFKNKIASIVGRYLFPDLYERVDRLEYRSFNRRFYAIEQCAEYLVGAQVDGDYCEFGVYIGTTFSHAYKWLSPLFTKMRFIAFDSFEGLPKPKGIDFSDGYSSHFYERQFSCTEDDFRNNILKNEVDLNKVEIIKGWFSKTLDPKSFESQKIEKIAVAWIDCDLYESTVPVLDFLTPRISVGSVLIFDDWRCYRNHPDFGEQLACREWLKANPNIKLAPLFSFGWNGIAFSVVEC